MDAIDEVAGILAGAERLVVFTGAGFPSNLAAIQLLKEYMASEIGAEDGDLLAVSKGLHLYEYSWDLARAVVRA